jgi:hypothetical protein
VQVEFGPPHGIITRLAEQQHADLIVVGPGKGRSLKERVLDGTCFEAPALFRRCPVYARSLTLSQRDLPNIGHDLCLRNHSAAC